MADQKLLIDGVASEMRIVREKIDDTNVRLGSLSQEVDSLRKRSAMPAAPWRRRQPGRQRAARRSTRAGRRVPAPPAATAAPGRTPPQPPPRRRPLACRRRSLGPRLLRLRRRPVALAIQGFETFLRAFPRSAQSDDAQLYIGEALQLDGKFKEAIGAFDKVDRRLIRRATACPMPTTSAG